MGIQRTAGRQRSLIAVIITAAMAANAAPAFAGAAD